jgi:hypothetical protein
MIYLSHSSLGQLDLTPANGYVVTSFTIGWPEVRAVMDNRALADGVVDTTTYLGSRAVTVALRLDNTGCPGYSTQDLIDAVTPYLSPRIRPTLVYTVDQNDPVVSHQRSLILRGVDAPLTVDAPKALTLVCQWVASESFTQALEDTCAVAILTGGTELGRPYDLDYDRDYPSSPPFGITYFYPSGNAPMDWILTLTSEIEDPTITVNGIDIIFTGLTLLPGQTVIIDTQARTILRNGDPNDSVYGLTNFFDWTWDNLRVRPGENSLLLRAVSTAGGSPAATLCYYDRWHL